MAKFIITAGFPGEDVGLDFKENIDGGDAVERAYRTYVLAGIAKVTTKAAVIAQTGDDGVQRLISEAAD